jgi:hypothetical protein
MNTPLYPAGQPVRVNRSSEEFQAREDGVYVSPLPGLPGFHQIDFAGVGRCNVHEHKIKPLPTARVIESRPNEPRP